MKRFIACMAFGLSISISPLKLAGDVSPPCYKQMQVTFFKDLLVAQALALHRIPQNIWIFIARDLKNASSQVPAIVQNMARAEVPNPLDPPFNREGAVRILQAALYSVYYPVVNSYRFRISNSNINDDTINGSFRYIWLQQQAQLVSCLGG